MRVDEISKKCAEVKNLRQQLDILNTEETEIELRVFTQGNWVNLSYTTTEKAIRNMVIHQIRMEIQNKILKCKREIRQLTAIPKKA